MFTKSWKVYGYTGHRQKVSFFESKSYDWSFGDNVRLVELICSDKTGTNDYAIIKITRNTESECDAEFIGQLYDGVFENARVGRWEVFNV